MPSLPPGPPTTADNALRSRFPSKLASANTAPNIKVDALALQQLLKLRGPGGTGGLLGCSTKTVRWRALELVLIQPGAPVITHETQPDGSVSRVFAECQNYDRTLDLSVMSNDLTIPSGPTDRCSYCDHLRLSHRAREVQVHGGHVDPSVVDLFEHDSTASDYISG